MRDETAKLAGDVISLTVIGGTLMNLLPAVAAVLSIVWSIIRIYETKTVRKWLGKEDA
jgi:DMSO reductase anchor subunit